MLIRSILCLFLICQVDALLAGKYFHFTPLLIDAYEDVIALRLDDATRKIEYEKKEAPDNVLTYHIENYIGFFTVFLGERKEDYSNYLQNKEIRLKRIRAGDSNDPYFQFSQAEILLQTALLRLKFEDYLWAFSDVAKAYRLLQSNDQKFPDFVANKKSLGVLHAIFGSIPDRFRWCASLIGFEGTIAQGRTELESILNYTGQEAFIFRKESMVIYAYVLLHLCKDPEAAWEIINKSQLDTSDGLLACFVKANIALRTGRGELAIEILEKRPDSKEYHTFHQLDYLLGLAKLYKLDPDADDHLRNFTCSFEGRHYIKDAYLKLAWYEMLFNNGLNYDYWTERCQSEGMAVVDEDIFAQKMAEGDQRPHADLLKARLLFDGGYFDRAKKVLNDVKPMEDPYMKLELNYRKGRVYQALGDFKNALELFGEVMQKEGHSGSYMVANAALQSGMINEEQGEYKKAYDFYQKCLESRSETYRTSLHQKARAGMARTRKN